MAPSLKSYTVSTMLFQKYGGENIGVANYLSGFLLLLLDRVNIKLNDGNMGHIQGIGIILSQYSNCQKISRGTILLMYSSSFKQNIIGYF